MLPYHDDALEQPEYEIWFAKDDGSRLGGALGVGPGGTRRAGRLSFGLVHNERVDLVEGVVKFSYTLAVNSYGPFSLTLPEEVDLNILALDNRVLFWRRPPGGQLSLDYEGFIRKRRTMADRSGNIVRVVSGYSLEYLLAGRQVAYPAGHAQASQTDQADDMLKAIARFNLGSSALTGNGRKSNGDLSTTFFSVEADAAGGPSITKAFSYRNVLDVLKEIAQAARTAGTEVYFAIRPTTEAAFEFQTRIGQPGRDRTSDTGQGGLIFGLDRGNLELPILEEDATDEVNYAYALGQGEGANRVIQTAEDTTRSQRSLWGKREGKIDARQNSSAAGVTDEADSLLVARRPVNMFSAKLLSRPGSVYGLDWWFGDRVTVSFDARQFDALVRAVTVSVDETGREEIDTMLEAYL